MDKENRERVNNLKTQINNEIEIYKEMGEEGGGSKVTGFAGATNVTGQSHPVNGEQSWLCSCGGGSTVVAKRWVELNFTPTGAIASSRHSCSGEFAVAAAPHKAEDGKFSAGDRREELAGVQPQFLELGTCSLIRIGENNRERF